MKRRAVAQLKGGVGKSTTTLFLAEHWALRGKKILVVDLDPQASVSYMLLSSRGVSNAESMHRTLPQLFADAGSNSLGSAFSYIVARASDLQELQGNSAGLVSVLPCIPRLWFSHYQLDRQSYLRGSDPVTDIAKLLKSVLAEVESQYDCVLFDCPPGFNSLTRAAIRLAPEAVIAPTLADEVSIRSLADFATLGLENGLGIGWRETLHVVVSRYTNSNQQQSKLDQLRATYRVFDPPIPMRDQVLVATEHLEGSHRSYAAKYGRPLLRPLSGYVMRMTAALFDATFP
jgi:cellulose biosynthesis protein BcsQ